MNSFYEKLDAIEQQDQSKDLSSMDSFMQKSERLDQEKAKSAENSGLLGGKIQGGLLEGETIPRLVGQTALGAAKLVTWPADIIKKAGDELYDAGIKKALREGNQEAAEKIRLDKERWKQDLPTQAMFEEKAGRQLGTDLEPQSGAERIARGTGELGLGIWGLLGSLSEEGLNQLGVPKWLSSLAGIATSVGGSVKRSPKKLSAESEELVRIAKEKNLPEAQLNKYAPEEIKASVAEGKVSKFEADTTKSMENAINKVIDENIPLSRLAKEGIDVEQLARYEVSKAKKLAQETTDLIHVNEVKDFLRTEREAIRNRAPKASAADEKVMHELESLENALVNDAYTAEEWIQQYRNINNDRKKLYKNPQFSGAESELAEMYGKVQDKVINAIEISGQKELANTLRAGNKIFAEKEKLARVNKILKPVFEAEKINLNNLSKVLKNDKNSAWLEKTLGKEGLQDLKDIAYYGRKTQDRLSKVKISKPMEEQLRHLGFGGSLILLMKKTGKAKSTISEFVRGRAILEPKIRTDIAKLFKDYAKNGIHKGLAKYSDALEEDIRSSYGSIENFMKMSEEIEE